MIALNWWVLTLALPVWLDRLEMLNGLPVCCQHKPQYPVVRGGLEALGREVPNGRLAGLIFQLGQADI